MRARKCNHLQKHQSTRWLSICISAHLGNHICRQLENERNIDAGTQNEFEIGSICILRSTIMYNMQLYLISDMHWHIHPYISTLNVWKEGMKGPMVLFLRPFFQKSGSKYSHIYGTQGCISYELNHEIFKIVQKLVLEHA